MISLVVAACLVGMALTFGGELGGGRAAGNGLAVLSSFGFAGLPLLLRLDQQRLLATEDARPRASQRTRRSWRCRSATRSRRWLRCPQCVAHPVAGETAPRTYLVLIALGVLQIGLPYVLYASAVRKLRALESSLLATIEPVLSPVWVVLRDGRAAEPARDRGGSDHRDRGGGTGHHRPA